MPVVLGAAAALLFATDVTAQENPDLSGTWTRVEDGAAAAAGGRGGRGGGRGGLGTGATITQTAEVLTITRTTQNGETVANYNLDGSPSENMVAGRGGTSTARTSTAVWTDGKLVITTAIEFGGNSFEQVLTLSLDAEGNLVAASSGGGGRGGRGGGGPTEVKYTKG